MQNNQTFPHANECDKVKGFYYHYKHDPEKDEFNYVYEVLGTALHTEVENLTDSVMVVYRPLYNCDIPLFVRPLTIFMEMVDIQNCVPRFTKVTDSDILDKLRQKSWELKCIEEFGSNFIKFKDGNAALCFTN